MKHKVQDIIGMQDAMDNIAAIMSINMDSPPPIGITKKNRIITDEEEFPKGQVQWLSEEGTGPILSVLDMTYRTIHQHLLNLYENGQMNWESEKSRKGIAAMMALVGESAEKMDVYLTYRLGKALEEKTSEREEFKALQKFYSTQFSLKFEKPIEGAAAWEEEWKENEAAPLLDLTKSGLKDFEAVRRDEDYELFYIRNEEGNPYFNAELLRNIKLSADFDLEMEDFEEDPLLKTRAMQDRDLHASAGQILRECYPSITDFLKNANKLSENALAESLKFAIIALFLAGNPRYLLQNTTGKSCLQYFDDFHHFLRRAMKSMEYQKLIAYPPDKSDKSSAIMLYLTHSLSCALFRRTFGVKQEAIGLIHRTMRRGEEIKQKEKEHLLKGDTIWNQFLLDDEKFRTLLSLFPNGPLFKILDLIREEQDENTVIPFDPIIQGNLPFHLFDLQRGRKTIQVLRIASPTKQIHIQKAEVVDEFRGFLRFLISENKKHLIINLQDRTSWKEHARSSTLEALPKNAEFSHQVYCITLPKATDFYYQNNEYLNMNQAVDFLESFRLQFNAPEECGYFFPSAIKQSELVRFVDSALPLIHEHFFHNKNVLTRKNREDFIEIFYQFLILKCIDHLQPNSMSFTCKDAIDTGAAASSAFYGFSQILSEGLDQKEKQDLLRFFLYAPALFIRERAIDQERFNRTLSLLERVDVEISSHGPAILKAIEGL